VPWLIGILTLCLVTVGCTSGGSGPASSSTRPTTSAAASPSASATPTRSGPLTTGPGVKPGETPPTRPPGSTAHDSGAALEFAIFAIKSLDWAIATTDSTPIRAVSTSACKTCATYIQTLDHLAATGGQIEGGRLTVHSAKVVEGASNIKSDQIVEFQVVQQPATIVDPPGTPTVESTLASTYTTRAYLDWTGSGWTLVEIAGPK
jgi:hypothetical protein